MKTFRVVLKVQATLYAYYDFPAKTRKAVEQALATQEGIDDLVTSTAPVREITEPQEDANWLLDEIGPSSEEG